MRWARIASRSLAAKGLVAREEADARQLLRNRARAFGGTPFANVLEHGAEDADAVDAVVLVKRASSTAITASLRCGDMRASSTSTRY